MEVNICSECGKAARAIWVDFGIGPYEYWGQQCNQEDWQEVSDCCNAELRCSENETEENLIGEYYEN